MFAIPSLADLVERARRSFRANLPGSDAWLWPNNIYVSAKVIAGAVSEVFGFADYISRQKFALTADGESLDMHGSELGLSRRPAAPARGQVVVTVVGGGSVSIGALFRRADEVSYRSLVDASLIGDGDMTIDVVSTMDGKAANAEAGESLEIVSGVIGDALAAVGDDAIVFGADVEDDESFRGRILFRKRYPPHGGAAADYVMWAGEVSGVSVDAVTRRPDVFVERLWQGPGSVRVFPLMYDLYPNGIASAGDITRVADHIEMVRPSGAVVTVAAPTAVPINITIDGLSPDTTAVREAVLAELRASFRRLSRVAGTDTAHGGMPFLATPETFSRSWIWQAIANATGEERHILTAPAADVVLAAGEIAVLGTVTFI